VALPCFSTRGLKLGERSPSIFMGKYHDNATIDRSMWDTYLPVLHLRDCLRMVHLTAAIATIYPFHQKSSYHVIPFSRVND
jgi:hypothetical protein